MKRSELNGLIQDAIQFCDENHFVLPPFAHLRAEEWAGKLREYREIKDNMLGWDVTDFGRGDYKSFGLLLFTMRNGNQQDPKTYPKPYAEKMMLINEKQMTPCHYHWHKMEDIINRGTGVLVVKVNNANEDDTLDTVNPVTVHVDGRTYKVPAGGEVRLEPGMSITLMQRQYHSFWAEAGKGRVLAGEVSMCNDDSNDNRFLEPLGRFPQVEEDEPAMYLLQIDYDKYMN